MNLMKRWLGVYFCLGKTHYLSDDNGSVMDTLLIQCYPVPSR